MAGYTSYTTSGGENWGFLANKFYGDPYDIKTITDANPDVKLDGVLKPGITLRVPVIDTPSNLVDDTLLPFWKRSGV